MTIRKKVVLTYIGIIIIPLFIFGLGFKVIEQEFDVRVRQFEERNLLKDNTVKDIMTKSVYFALLKDPLLESEHTVDYLNDLFNRAPIKGQISNDQLLYSSDRFQVERAVITKLEVEGQTYTIEFSRFDPILEIKEKFSKNMIITFTIFALFYIILHIIFIRMLSKIIIKPISSLRAFAIAMKDGEYDYEINYNNKDDEIGKVYTAFDQMREEIKESKALDKRYQYNRKKLIANISHDLKTPMTAIKGYIEGILDGVANTPEKLDKYINTIHHYIVDMDQLINDLFLFSKLDIDKIQFDFKPVSLKKYFEDCTEDLEYTLDTESITFNYENHCKDDVFLKIDAQQLKRVINNIIFNSVKHLDAANGRIDFFIDPIPKGCRVTIADNGPGVSKDQLEVIFDDFYKGDTSRKFVGGSGLGLSIAKKILEAHGGKIYAQNPKDEGLKIIFTLLAWEENNEENINH
ncbi:MAG TPA: HAMP domain-containing sensor histidine kinase [Clostridia bacterium]|nr:HAMP domain-containing sensor histidine kinase [Clostridia bacterium]